MQSFGKLNKNALQILHKGVCTNIVEDGLIVAQHYHFVGAPFCGLWRKKMTEGQIERKKQMKIEKERRRVQESRKYATRNPSILARLNNDNWDFILAHDNINEADTQFVAREQACRQQELRVKEAFIRRRMENEQLVQDGALVERFAAFVRRVFKERIQSNASRINRQSESFLDPPRMNTEYNQEMLLHVIAEMRDLEINNNSDVVDIEAGEINQEQHSTNGNVNGKILETEIGTLIFVDMCTDFVDFVRELREQRIDPTDEDVLKPLQPLLFGTPNDRQVFEILSKVWWDQFMFPKLFMPVRFADCLDGVNLKSEWSIIERFRILSTPPRVHSEKENTKRNSKRYKPEKETRIERLQNSHPHIARKLVEKLEFDRLQKIYKKQKEQRIANSDKMIEKLELHGFNIPVKITFPQFQNLTQKAVKAIPKEIRENVHWVDIFASLWSLINNTDYASRWTAIRMLYLNFKVEGMEFVVFAAMIFKLYKYLGSESKVECPKIHAEMAKIHYVESSPMAIIVTLILTLLFKHDPRKSTVDRVISSFRDIPSASTGLQMIMGAAEKTLEFISGSCNDEYSLENRLKKLDTTVKSFLSPEGQRRLKEEKGAFDEVALLKIESLELAQFVRANTVQGVLLNKLSYEINTLYTKAQILGATGHGYRRRPVVLHLNGDAGIGKTRLINYISADTISLILQLENDKYCKEEFKEELREKVRNYEQFVYFRPVGLKYQQNFKSYASKIYVCDDANQITPSFQNGEMTYPMELIHLNNSHDHMLNVAEIEKKADALFKSSLVIATDNIKRPDLYYLVCEEAYDRRIDFSFTVEIKPQYRSARFVNGKIKYLINMDKIDPTKSNTEIYNFIDSHNIVYSYEDMIEMIEEKLVEVADSHIKDIKVFGDRALDRLEKRSFNLTNPLSLELSSHFKENISGASSVRFEKHNTSNTNRGKYIEEITTQAETHEYKEENGENAIVHSLFKKFKRKTRDVLNKFNDKVEDTMEVIDEITPTPIVSLRDRVADYWRRTQFAFIAFLLNFFTWQTLNTWERRLRRTKDFISVNRKVILHTSAVLTAVLVGYMYLRGDVTKKKHKNKPEKRRTEKTVEGKYDGGQPSKAAPKGKKPPKTPVISTPITYSSPQNRIETIHDLAGFMSKPTANVACQRAYSVAKSLISNSYYIYADYIKDGQKETAGLRGFFIKDRIFVTNRHLIPNNQKEFETVKFSLYNRFNEYEDIPISKVTINTFVHPDEKDTMYYDIVWIDFGRVNMKSHFNLTEMSSNSGCDNFVSETEMDDLFGSKIIVCTLSIAAEYASKDHKNIFTGKAAWYFEMQHTKVTKVNTEALELLGRDNEDLYSFNTMEYPMQSFPGYCGSVVIGNNAEYPGKILGIHMAGYNNVDKSYGQIITKEMIESITQLGVHLERIEGKFNTHIKADEFTYLRVVPHLLRSPSKTKLRKSILYNTVFESQKEPAQLSFTPDGEHVICKSMRKYLTPHKTLSFESEHLFKSILHHKFTPIRKVRELTREEAIKGVEGNEFICAINRKSSAGYPLNVETTMAGKKEYLGENENWILDHPRVEQLINEFHECVGNNVRPNIVFVATIKDELVSKAKAKACKSRAFAAAPLAFTIIFREKYLDYFATIMEERIFNYSLVGVNMYSKDVDDIVNLLAEVAPKNSKQFLAGDFTNFDGTLILNLLWMIFDFIEYIYGRESKVCESLWNELVDSQQLFGNTVIQVSRGQPSGNPATTLVNTLYNIGLNFMVLFQVLEEIDKVEAIEIQQDLHHYYRGVYYGDDNLHSYHKKLVNIMDPNLITTVMKRHGHVYTTDAKDSTHFEYRYLSEVTILKRHFAYDNHYNRWIAPLELVSIFEPINWDRVKDNSYEMKEIQMQVNVRTAIRELSLHTPEVFDKYVPLLLHECKIRNLVLEPECYFGQLTLRKIVRNSDGLLFFSNDYFNQLEPIIDVDENLELEEEGGTIIQLGGRPESSPLEDSQKQTRHQFNPTVNVQKWIAQTHQEYKQNNNNKMQHMENGNLIFNGQGGNGAIIPFQIPAITQNSIISMTLSASSDSERSGTVTLTSDWFDIGVRMEAQSTANQQLTTLPRGVTNVTASIVTTLNSTCRFVFSLNVSPVLPSKASVSEPLWVTQYENPVSTLSKPTLHMMRYSDPNSQNAIQKQIVTLDTVMRLKPETVPKQIELDMQKLGVMKEKRDHSIKDVLSRMYAIYDFEIPPGGATGDNIQIIDILSEFLSQNNVSAKLEGFTFLRTNFIITILTRTLTTTSGGIIASFYPQLNDIATRSVNILQASQTPNKRISVSGSEGIVLKVPFISAFYGKNLVSGSGEIGKVVIKLLTPLNINPTSLRVFIQADEDDIEVTYPTFAAGPNARENIDTQIRRLQERQQQLINDGRDEIIRVGNAENLAQGIARRLHLPDVLGPPSVHMHKSSTRSNIISVKWQPATNHVNKDGEDVAHHITLSRENNMKVSKEFGTAINEMTIPHIAKSKQIIAIRRITPAMQPGHIIYARPCSIVDFMSQNGQISMTHQTWLAMMAQKWKAILEFELNLYLNQFHAVTLSLIFNPGDQGEFQEGQTLSYDLINKPERMIVEFDGQRTTASFEVKPAMNTAIKAVPTARLGDVTANALTWTNDCFSEECSYGMFYVAVEVKLKAAASVAPYVDFTVDFSARDFCLGDPTEYIPLVPSVHCQKPRVHMDKGGLTTETAEIASAETRSEHFEQPQSVNEGVQNTGNGITTAETMGDKIESIKDILDAYTPFSPIITVNNGEAIAIEAYAFRTLSDLAAANKFKHHDWIDYFSAGYAYYKGKINMRLGKVTDQQGPFGEVNSTTRRNPVAMFASTSGTGITTFQAPNSAKSGSRVIPLFKEECIPQINIPYYQPFHMSRITNSNNYNSANQPKILIFRPYNTEQVRLSRATDKDFLFGFLTALPTFTLVSGSIFE